MGALFHFIFQLFKIAILSAFYALILITIVIILEKFIKNKFLRRVATDKKTYLKYFAVPIAIFLFIFSFTYWGNHGLGDSARIPVGHGQVISNINWTAYGILDGQETGAGNQIETTRFKVSNGMVSGNLDSWFHAYGNKYFVLDLETNKLTEFVSATDFDRHAEQHNLPKSHELLSYQQNYSAHWHGIRMLLLP
jgi:hypothetical protein